MTAAGRNEMMPTVKYGLAIFIALIGTVAGGSAAELAVQTGSHGTATLQGPLRYDTEYPLIHYSEAASHNAIARLQERMNRGEVKLQFNPVRGYIDSLLKNLRIDPSSQVLVYSKSSLQIDWIRAATPRAIYFNEDTSVAWEKGAPLVEIVTMDSALGPVFYALPNRQDMGDGFDREGSRCLNCHDKYGMMGGGVPNFLATSSLVDTNGLLLKPDATLSVTDETPIESRWGGWYVTGQHGSQVHLGNIQVRDLGEAANLERVRRGNLDTLDGLFDTSAYLTNKSDIVALLVLEHQITVYNLIARLNFKARTLIAPGSPAAADPQTVLRKMSEPLVRAMLFVDAVPLKGRISGGAGFDTWLQAQGPRDSSGRSLRDLDLKTRLFRYPLSYLIYSDAFEGLPDDVRRIVYQRLVQVLTGQDESPVYSGITAGDRRAVLEILTATQPAFASFLARPAAAP